MTPNQAEAERVARETWMAIPTELRAFVPVAFTDIMVSRYAAALLAAEERGRQSRSEPDCPGADCRMCNGEYCKVHFSGPCECDVLGRHGFDELKGRHPNPSPSEDVRKVAKDVVAKWKAGHLLSESAYQRELRLGDTIATALQAERDKLTGMQGNLTLAQNAVRYADERMTQLEYELDKLNEAAKVIEPFASVAHHDDALASKDGGAHYWKAKDSTGICHCGFAPHDAGLTIGHCRAAADWLAKHKPV